MSTTTAITKKESGAITLGAQYGYTPEFVDLIKNSYARDATDNELQMFLDVCHSTKLNPFAKEIYFWKQSGKVIIHTGIDGYRLIADRTGRYAPGPPIKRTMENGNHVASTAYVRKKVGADWFLIEETAWMKEWKKDSPFWKDINKASHQLDITAERHALRKAFPRSYPQTLGVEDPGGEPIEIETTEQKAEREYLIDGLTRIGKFFLNEEQQAVLVATVTTTALPVLQERYTNAIAKLREETLSKIGTKLQGEAFSAFIVANFPAGIETADADEFFGALERLETVEAGEIVETPQYSGGPVSVEDEEAAAIAEASAGNGELISPNEAELVSLREEVMDKLMTISGGEDTKIDDLLDGRVVPSMTKPQLEKFLVNLANADTPF